MHLRSLIKTSVGSALCVTRLDRLIHRIQGSTAVPMVIGYHRVVEDFSAESRDSMPPMLVSRSMLEAHLDWLAPRYRFISLDEVGARLASDDPFREPVAALTFDDGYRDFYDNAFPILQRRQIPAAVFVVTELIGKADLQIHDEMYLLVREALRREGLTAFHARVRELVVREGVLKKSDAVSIAQALLEALPQSDLRRIIDILRRRFGLPAEACGKMASLSWEMLDEMHRAGVTVGSHTKSHVWLPNEDRATVRRELVESREKIQAELGIAPAHFVYPAGRFTEDVVDLVGAAGYRFAYGTCLHRSARHPLLTIPRQLFWEKSCVDASGRFSPAIMSCQMNRVFEFVAGCRRDHRGAAVPMDQRAFLGVPGGSERTMWRAQR